MIPTASIPDEILPIAIVMVEEEILAAEDEADVYELAARWLKLCGEVKRRKALATYQDALAATEKWMKP